MVGKLDAAFRGAKKAIESMYRDTATVYTQSNVKNSSGFDDDEKELEIVTKDIPVKVSKSGLKSGGKDTYAEMNYDAVIYLDTKLELPSGAIIDVTDVNGRIRRYKRASGGYMSYITHQEVAVVFEDRK